LKKLTFGKKEKLKSKKAIDALFMRGKAIQQYPLRLVYLLHENRENEPGTFIKCTVSVSARNFRKATVRNLIKRRMREAYRLQKQILDAHSGQSVDLMFIYTGKELMNYQEIRMATEKLLGKLSGIIRN